MLSWVYLAIITLIVIVTFIRNYHHLLKFLALLTNLSVSIVSWTLSIIFEIQELIDKTKQVRYFTKLDVCWGYNNIQIKEKDK